MRFLRTPSTSSYWSAVGSRTHSSTVSSRGCEGVTNLIAMVNRSPVFSSRAYALYRVRSTGPACSSMSCSQPQRPIRLPFLRLRGVIREQRDAREHGSLHTWVGEALAGPFQRQTEVLGPWMMGEAAFAVR